MNRIDRLYNKARIERRLTFNAYLCAGYPSVEETFELIRQLEGIGVDSIELGMPFSDPVADGPALQKAHLRALSSGLTLGRVLEGVSELRKNSDVPLCLMSYYNPIHRYGEERLVRDALSAGIDGLIVPDLPPEEAGSLLPHARKHDLKTIFFIAPTTPPERVPLINEASTGFIYCISVTGVTGAREKLPEELCQSLERLRELCDKPLVVGFGVSSPQHIHRLRGLCDGVIVGSAIAQYIERNSVDEMPDFICSLVRAVRNESE